MKNILFFLLAFPAFSFAQNGFVITGKVAGIAEGSEVRINHAQEGNALVAKGNIKDGAFTITGAVPEPGLYYITLGKEQPQHIYLENKPIKISGSKKEIKNIKVEGSSAHNDFVQFRNTFNPLIGELNGKAALMERALDEKKRNELMKELDSLTQLTQQEVKKFVTSKPGSYVSPFVMFVTAQLSDDPFAMEQQFNLLSEEVRNSNIGKSLAAFIAYNKVGAVGTDAMDFTQADVDGKEVSLSSFKGKYVLVDFWASWCKPCREENPNVVKAFNKFNAKNFTILGVSLDQTKDAWLNAIKKDGLTWTHVSDLQFWNNAAAQLYHVQGIPQNFLIDPNGKIIARNLRGAALDAKLCELLGCD
jgi:peroxiredoxin